MGGAKIVKAVVISVGDELLAGEVADSNAAIISARLTEEGVEVTSRHTVGDRLPDLASALQIAVPRADIVVISGGLGPTPADLTRQALAAGAGKPLIRDENAGRKLREYFAARGRIPAENNFRQCEVPEGAVLLENTCGTAPGIFLEMDKSLIFALPGPPAEMREMLEHAVIPRVRERVKKEGGGKRKTRVLRLAGIGESNAAEALGNLFRLEGDPLVGIYASTGEVRIRLSSRGAGAGERLTGLETEVRKRLGKHVYGTDDETMEAVVGKILRERKATLALAESCTGGLIASRITDIPGSSDYFAAGIVAYADEAKIRFLGVPAEIIRENGSVSEECARAMAEGARARSGADFALAVT
ncbi:MAG: CinA family nicotinamide mononucleotide deamidase-related protein, partial [Candidatus Aureabacteria bacterium]|nr:CinA family nicotinamide mononucleotide deamidase-related protein [Candidatus Auribacterota bacterium]